MAAKTKTKDNKQNPVPLGIIEVPGVKVFFVVQELEKPARASRKREASYGTAITNNEALERFLRVGSHTARAK